MLQSQSKGFGTPPLVHMFLYGICSHPAKDTHKHGLNKNPPPPRPRTKLRSLTFARYVKRGLTCNTQHCSGEEGGNLEVHFPHLKHKVS